MPIETEYEQSEKALIKQALKEHYAETTRERTEFYEHLVEQLVQKRLARVGAWTAAIVFAALGAVVLYVANLIGGHK